MVSLSSTAEVVSAMQRARSIELSAYVLRPGAVLDALQAAAGRGAHVRLRLECKPYGDEDGSLAAGNAGAVTALAQAGADARLTDCDGAHPAHLKEARVDGAVYLDDRNWPGDDRDTILHVDAGENFATRKDEALRREARTIYRAGDAREAVDVESESFGFGRIYAALKYAASRVPVRLLVARRDVTPRSLPALRRLQAAGVTVRTCSDDEKLAVSAREAWVGSANASAGVPGQSDWGLRIFDGSIVRALHARFERNWNAGQPIPGVMLSLSKHGVATMHDSGNAMLRQAHASTSSA